MKLSKSRETECDLVKDAPRASGIDQSAVANSKVALCSTRIPTGKGASVDRGSNCRRSRAADDGKLPSVGNGSETGAAIVTAGWNVGVLCNR